MRSNCGPSSSIWHNRLSRLIYANTFKRRDGPTEGDCIGYRPPKEKLGSYYSDSWLSAKRIFKEYGDPNAIPIPSPLQPQHHQDTNDSDSEEGAEVFDSSYAIIHYLDQYCFFRPHLYSVSGTTRARAMILRPLVRVPTAMPTITVRIVGNSLLKNKRVEIRIRKKTAP